MKIDLNGVIAATVTPFTPDGDIDERGMEHYLGWLSGWTDLHALMCNGIAGEAPFLTLDERMEVIRSTKRHARRDLPVVSGIIGDGTRAAAHEAERAAEAGADALLVFPVTSSMRFGYQEQGVVERHRAVAEASGLPIIAFEYPAISAASYSIDTILALAAIDGVVGIKHGVRNMGRWDHEIPIIRREAPDFKVMTSHDEYLMPTMWAADGVLVSYAAVFPELVTDLFRAVKSGDAAAALVAHDRMAPVTHELYGRTPAISSLVACKEALAQRGAIPRATVRSPLVALTDAEKAPLIAAMEAAGIETGAGESD